MPNPMLKSMPNPMLKSVANPPQPVDDEEQGALPSPRLTSQLYEQEDAEQAFLRAWRSRRLPHAWLLQGTRGVGKATFAYRAARALLSRHRSPSDEDVAATFAAASMPSSEVFRQVQLATHPDLAVLASEGEKEITVEQARELVRFLHKTPVSSRYRVGIVDSADRLNREAANALLKLVEEPGRRVVLLLVCHASEALPATLRSRCRALPFQDISCQKIADVLCTRGKTQATARRIAALSAGSFAYAGLLLDAGGEEFLEAFGAALSRRLADRRRTTGEGGAKSADSKALSFSFSDMLADKSFAATRPEAFRFLWQRFLAAAVRAQASAGKKRAKGDESWQEGLPENMLALLSCDARDAIERTTATFWQELWQRSVPHLLGSRAARGGDVALSADYALEGLREAC